MTDDITQQALNLEHAKASYANAQEVIRFVDTKTGVMTGIVTITTGLPFALLNLLISSDTPAATNLLEWYSSCGFVVKTLITGAGVAGILFGVFSLLASTSGLKSRAPATKQAKESIIRDMVRFLCLKIANAFVEILRCFLRIKGKVANEGEISESKVKSPQPLTSLFPYHAPESAKEAKAIFDKLAAAEYTTFDVLAEYRTQLLGVGGILHTKIQRNRDAVHWFEWQLAAYFVATLLACVIFNVCPLVTNQNVSGGTGATKEPAKSGAKKPQSTALGPPSSPSLPPLPSGTSAIKPNDVPQTVTNPQPTPAQK